MSLLNTEGGFQVPVPSDITRMAAQDDSWASFDKAIITAPGTLQEGSCLFRIFKIFRSNKKTPPNKKRKAY